MLVPGSIQTAGKGSPRAKRSRRRRHAYSKEDIGTSTERKPSLFNARSDIDGLGQLLGFRKQGETNSRRARNNGFWTSGAIQVIEFGEENLALSAATTRTPAVEPVHPIMVVEDHPDVRELMALLLESMNREVITAENGRAALEHLQQWVSSLPCLIFLDLMMPEMNGFQFLKALESESKFANIPVVVSAIGDLVKGLPSVSATLTKPTSFE